MLRLLKEPFVHFLLLGVLIFAAYAWFNRAQHAADHIVVDQARFDHLRALWKIQWRREPDAAESRALIDRYLRQEVFYREALRLGLDRDDEIIRRRLAQKMEAVADDLGTLMQPPDEARLRAFHRTHPELFTRPGGYAFEQVLFTTDEPDREAAMQRLLQSLRAGGEVPATKRARLGVRNLWPATSMTELGNAFGEGFAAQLDALPLLQWSGPVRSGYGWHLLRIQQRNAPTLAPFEQVREDVAREYAYQADLQSQDRVYQELLKRYVVEVNAALPRGAATTPGSR